VPTAVIGNSLGEPQQMASDNDTPFDIPQSDVSTPFPTVGVFGHDTYQTIVMFVDMLGSHRT
jgi:hypothetical protein